MMTRVFKAVVVVFKPANQWQLESMIRDYQVTDLVVLYQADNNRLDEETIKTWYSIKTFQGAIRFKKLSFEGLTKKGFCKTLEEQGKIHLLGMPLFVGYKFWGNVLWARKNFIVVANIFDGSVENTNIKDSFLRLKTKRNSLYSLLKLVFLPKLIFLFGRADIAYSPYYPLYRSCFSRKTLPEVSTLDEDKRKMLAELLREEEMESKYLMVTGYEVESDFITENCGNNFIATTKEKAIIINGKKIEMPYYICVEELLHVFKPKYAIGCVSDAIVAVKSRYFDVPCFAIRSKMISRVWGDLYNELYEKQTRLFDIKIINLEDVVSLKDDLN